MGQIYSTRLIDSLKIRSGRKKKFFFLFNRSNDESFYVIELNLVSFFFFFFFLPKTEFFPRTMKMSQKVSKMGDIARNV